MLPFLEYQQDEVLDLSDEADHERIAPQGTHVTPEALEKQRERARRRALHGIDDETLGA